MPKKNNNFCLQSCDHFLLVHHFVRSISLYFFRSAFLVLQNVVACTLPSATPQPLQSTCPTSSDDSFRPAPPSRSCIRHQRLVQLSSHSRPLHCARALHNAGKQSFILAHDSKQSSLFIGLHAPSLVVTPKAHVLTSSSSHRPTIPSSTRSPSPG